MCTRRQSKGYTLIEVLVAMMILAMSLTVLMRIFSSGLLSMAISSDYAHAVLLAEAQLAAAGSSQVLVPGETYGNDDDKFRWTRTVEEYIPNDLEETERLPVAAYRVNVLIEWSHFASTRQVNLSTIKLHRLQGAGERT